MSSSKLIAGLVGPLMIAIGLAVLINHHIFPEMISQLAQNYAVIFLSGILGLLAGVAIVRVHNDWSVGWQIILTVIGWLLIIGGLLRMWFPQRAWKIAASFGASPTPLLVTGVVLLVIGAFLSFKA